MTCACSRKEEEAGLVSTENRGRAMGLGSGRRAGIEKSLSGLYSASTLALTLEWEAMEELGTLTSH